MNSNTVNIFYSFNSNEVIEWEYKIDTLIETRNGTISPLYPPDYKSSLKYEINNNNKYCCFISNCKHEGHYMQNIQEQNETNTFEPLNTKRLGISLRKHRNIQKRKNQLFRNEEMKTENNSTCCLQSAAQQLLLPRIPYHLDYKQQYCKYSTMSESNVQTIISEDEGSFMHFTKICDTKCITIVKEIAHNYVAKVPADNENKDFLCAKRVNKWRHHKHHTGNYSSLLYYVRLIMSCSYLLLQNSKTLHLLFILLLTTSQYPDSVQGLLVSKTSAIGADYSSIDFKNSSTIQIYNSDNNSVRNNNSINKRLTKDSRNQEQEERLGRGGTYLLANKKFMTSFTEDRISAGAYLDKFDNLERSLAAVLKKVAYGTTSTTKRSIPENSYVPSLTTIATPLLTTLRYQDKSQQTHLNIHHRNYELDLERDHALPTSAPNADILKSNNNPTYPNPNRHHNRERESLRHLINSTPKPSLPNILKKTNGQLPTIAMFPGSGELPSYSPPARSFFTPPLPPEYQHPFADKPTLRGTNNEGGIELNSGSYINRRPIPPPSLMPGHERIPFRPPDLGGTGNHNEGGESALIIPALSGTTVSPLFSLSTTVAHNEGDVKKVLNTPSKVGINLVNGTHVERINNLSSGVYLDENSYLYKNTSKSEVRKEVLPSLRRILSGSNGRKGDIPEVLLKQVTTRPTNYYHHSPSSTVLIDSSLLSTNEGSMENVDNKQNINKKKNVIASDINNFDDNAKITTKSLGDTNFSFNNITSTPSAAAAAIGGSEEAKSAISVAAATSTSSINLDLSPSFGKSNVDGSSLSTSSTSSTSSSTSSSTLASAAAHATWSFAWNIHVYLSVILFTILAVYSFYKMITYSKLTHLFSQSYFICIHLILIAICTTRTFYLCYDAYNIHSSFHIFVSEILLHLPATFLTISFAVLILFLSLKSLNHKNNRYSALIRPLTVIVGCGVHVVLCITLHYVESYTLQNHQQHIYYQQQQQLLAKRQQMQQQLQQQQQQQQQNHQNIQYNYLQNQYSYAANIIGLEPMAFSSSVASVQGTNFHQYNIAASVSSLPPPPPRVLSLICQIIYIFVCFSLGLLYLYLYRILKRILHSKSQNYIHGYQNLSYAIHITIATALLFVLLAALQVFGAISISSSRPLITQKTSEIDWLQWGYQFSLRLIEIAIITLISWVAGLKTSNGINAVNMNLTSNEGRVAAGQVCSLSVNPVREKNNVHNNQYNHSTMTNFFLPCTSSSSQEQFDADYPAVCNANTNLHTYTMRTGKLIYDDSFALNSFNATNTAAPTHSFHQPHHQLQSLSKQQTQSTYQHPYDSQSLHSSAQQNVSEYGSRINYQPENHLHYNDYLTDNTTDHYENPNFDLRGSVSAKLGSALVVNSNASNGTVQKFVKNSTSNSTTTPSSTNNSNLGSSSSSGSSATLQQQMLLLHGTSETCYSEPIHENFDFNNFEKKFKQQSNDNWPEAHVPTILNKRDKKKSLTTLERCDYDKPERRSSNSMHSCNSNTNSTSNGFGGSSRYASFNTFERAPFNNVRKSDTFTNITHNCVNITHDRNNSSSSATSATSASGPRNTSLGVQTLSSTERHHHVIPSRNRVNGSSKVLANNASGLDVFPRSTLERLSITHTQQRSFNQQSHINTSQTHHQQYSDDDEDDKDDGIMLTASSHQV